MMKQKIPDSISRSLRQVLLTGLIALLSTGPALADRGPPAHAASQGERWGEFEPLSQGFVGRRRVPPNFELPPEQRRLPETQIQARLQERPGAHGRERAAQARQNGPAAAARGRGRGPVAQTASATSAWLKTGDPGLYGVSIDDIASGAGMDARALRNRAQSGRLRLLNDEQSVSWYFDRDNGRILFAAEAYETMYADGNAYQLVFAQTPDSQRMSKTRAMPPGQARRGRGASLASGHATPFVDTLKFEEEPYWTLIAVAAEPDADYWFWDYLWAGRQDHIDVPLNLPYPAASGTARITVHLRGWTNLYPWEEHQVYAELNGVRVGPVALWNGFESAELLAEFDQGLLNPDGENTLRLRNVYTPGTYPRQLLDAIEVEYKRNPVAVQGGLWMRDVRSGSQAVTGFEGQDLWVIESPVRNSVLRRDVQFERGTGGWVASFAVGDENDFLVVESDSIRTPIVDGPASADLRSPTNQASYIVIAPREFTGTAEALAQHRRARFGSVQIVWLDDIYKEFGAGREDPHAIGQFMTHALEQWQLPPSMVMLVGKGSLDHKDRLGYGDSFMPVLMTAAPWALVTSDSRLLGLGAGEAPIGIGRLPIINDAEGLAYVGKLIAHESNRRGDDAFRAVLVADNPDRAGNFHRNADELGDRLLGLGFDGIVELYHPDGAVRTNFTRSETWESGYVSYVGHGSRSRLGDSRENFLHATDASLLSNTSFPIFTALTCSAGNHAVPAGRSLVDALVLNPEGGAIASVAPTGRSLDRDAHALSMGLVDHLFARGGMVGHAVADAKRQTGSQMQDFMAPMYSVIGDPAVQAR